MLRGVSVIALSFFADSTKNEPEGNRLAFPM
jgi:hypothetical protein